MAFILVQARKGEGWGGGEGVTGGLIPGCLLVDGPITWGVLISDGGGLIGGRSMKR